MKKGNKSLQREIRTKTKNVYFYTSIVYLKVGVNLVIDELNGYGHYDKVRIFVPYENIDYIKK